jgi:hypothetical protein
MPISTGKKIFLFASGLLHLVDVISDILVSRQFYLQQVSFSFSFSSSLSGCKFDDQLSLQEYSYFGALLAFIGTSTLANIFLGVFYGLAG